MIDVSKWFNELKKVNPEYVESISIISTSTEPVEYYFIASMFNQHCKSKHYTDKKICEYEMEQFLRKIEEE